MKLKKLFGGLLLSSFLAAGLGVSISASNKVVEVNAASVPSGVYVNIDNCQWKDWGAALSNIKAHFFNGGTGYTTWPGTAVTSVTIHGTTYGYAAVPSGATQVIFNAWGGDSNQNKTGDLTIPTDGKLLFTVNSHNTSSVQTGSWSNLDVIHPTSSLLTPSASTARVFINNDSAHQDWKSAKLGIRAWGGSCSILNNRPVTANVYGVSWFDGNYGNVWYGYADIPIDCTSFQVVRLSADTQSATVWSYSSDVSKSNTAFSCIYYLVGGSTDNMTLYAGGAKDDHAGSTLLAKVIESYDTCSSSNCNGYGDAIELNTNFYSHADDWAKSQTGTSRGGTSATFSSHFEGMLYRKSGGAFSSNTFLLQSITCGPASSLIIVVSATAVSIAAIGGYFLFKKKKND